MHSETGGGDSHASLMISALLRTIMITTMMRMTELRAKPEPKENKQFVEHNLKIFASAKYIQSILYYSVVQLNLS